MHPFLFSAQPRTLLVAKEVREERHHLSQELFIIQEGCGGANMEEEAQ